VHVGKKRVGKNYMIARKVQATIKKSTTLQVGFPCFSHRMANHISVT